MITTEKILTLIESELEKQQVFVVEIEVKPDNHIMLYLDSMTGVTIDQIVFFSREINDNLDREIEDYELYVSSAGLDMPLRHIKQYIKNTGRKVEVLRADGTKLKATLTKAENDFFEIQFEQTVKVEGKKRKQTVITTQQLTYNEVKSVKVIPDFGKN
ncbi:MAG TPA: ribosome assembly cofactor RimP [Bacteroidales bacterium]|nr:ribosome assembly cofactor RimP [Bacteroidales bacterium]